MFCLVKCPIWSNGFWSNVPFGQMDFLVKKLFGQQIFWSNVPFGQIIFWSKYFGQMDFGQTEFGQMSQCRGGLPLYNQCVQWVCTDDVCVCLNVCQMGANFSLKPCYLE